MLSCVLIADVVPSTQDDTSVCKDLIVKLVVSLALLIYIWEFNKFVAEIISGKGQYIRIEVKMKML